ncbi:MAG: protoporphyrinogen oxidase [Planctomycetales bacterium]|nr:protoporphyrinogen oxidase [Planctomycetales bacterium]
MRQRVAIIGGGISGLAAAHFLRETKPEVEVILLEASGRLGGVIRSANKDGFLIESAADNFITTSPVAIDLCRRLGLGDELLGTNAEGRGALVLCRGKLEPIPSGFLVMAPSRIGPILTTRILSTWGKCRAGLEFFVPRRKQPGDESLKSFVCRRFGYEMFERLVQPLVGGIYTADPNRLSVTATMPRFPQMEQEHGSLLRAMLRQRRTQGRKKAEKSGGARYSQFMTLRGGMSTLIEALAKSLPEGAIRLDSPVCAMVPQANGRWSILVAQGDPKWLEADAVIVATPANHAAEMLATADVRIADSLSQVQYASCAVISLAYRREHIQHPLKAFGFVVPLAEQRTILSCSFSSLKYPGRAPEDTVLMRVFIGGACQSGLLRLSREQLIQLAESELTDMLGISGPPVLRELTMQKQAMPQYHVGHNERVQYIDQQLERHPTLALAGSALRGVGVPGCIESGARAAQRVAAAINAPRSMVRPAAG